MDTTRGEYRVAMLWREPERISHLDQPQLTQMQRLEKKGTDSKGKVQTESVGVGPCRQTFR